MQFNSNKVSAYLTLVVLGLFTFIILNKLNLQLIFQNQQPLFLVGSEIFFEYLKQPGGIGKYIAEFITTTMYFKWLGSIVTSLLLLLSSVFYFNSLQRYTNDLIALLFSSAALLFSTILFASFNIEVEHYISLVTALIFSVYLSKIINADKVLLSTAMVSGALVVYFHLFGGLGLLLLSLFSIAILLNTKYFKLKYRLVFLIVFSLGYTFIPLVFANTIHQLLPVKTAYFSNIFELDYITVFVIASVIIFCGFFTHRLKAGKLETNKAYVLSGIISIIFIGLLLYLPQNKVDQNKKIQLEVDKLAENKDWDGILAAYKNDEEQKPDRFLVFQVNRAMFFKNQLLDSAFTIEQAYGTEGLFYDKRTYGGAVIPFGKIYYDLSYINEARHWGHEAFTIFGMQPGILKLLVDVNLILGKYNTASKYIMLLKKSLLFKEWASRKEPLLYYNELIEKCQEYKYKKELNPTKDFFSTHAEPIFNLKELYSQNNNNKMAFEYLILSYLLQHDLIHVVKMVPGFTKLGYESIPKLVQEAIILYLVKTGQTKINLGGYQIDKHNIDNFRNYTNLYMRYKNNDNGAKQELDDLYSNTFWYYLHFISSNKK